MEKFSLVYELLYFKNDRIHLGPLIIIKFNNVLTSNLNNFK